MNKHSLITALAVIIFSSCSSTPGCNGEEVKSTALDIAKESIITEQASFNFIKKDMYKYYFELERYAERRGSAALAEQIKKEVRAELSARKDSSIYNSHIDDAIESINGLDPVITNIRTSAKQPELKKCTCEAQVDLSNGKSMDVVYTAQRNDDGEIYVELLDIDI